MKKSIIIKITAIVCTMLAQIAHAQTAVKIFTGVPKINAPLVTANYPSTPFLFPIATGGERPMRWTATGLPAGLSLDTKTGFISGNVLKPGNYIIQVSATNKLGTAAKNINIIIGDKLAMTPPMGWNSWNTFAESLDENLVKEIADKMVSSGMRDAGYQYINLDDFWQLLQRDSAGKIQINKEKFPSGIKHLSDYVHARGLKLGLYSDAGDRTCGGVAGSYLYEEKDAKDFAAWGVDLLKYDYCHAPNFTDTAIYRYTRMYDALRSTNRSILLSVCEWGVRKPWNWASQVGGSSWRTTGDIYDLWDSDTAKGNIRGIIQIANRNLTLARYAGPGQWNDPDMLIVGIYGKGKATSSHKLAVGCTDTEYRTHMSLWCMMAAPLICGNDLRTMNEFTLSTLLNPDIIAIDQDPLGKQCTVWRTDGDVQILTKPLINGSLAVAVFNRGKTSHKTTIDLKSIGFNTVATLRNVWLQKDIANANKIDTETPSHGCDVFIVKQK